jgi:hypothetical protein
MSSRISWSGNPVLPVDPQFRSRSSFLEPAFALRSRALRYRWACSEFPGKVFEQDLLFRTGQFVHGGFDFGERAHARKVAHLVQLRQPVGRWTRPHASRVTVNQRSVGESVDIAFSRS